MWISDETLLKSGLAAKYGNDNSLCRSILLAKLARYTNMKDKSAAKHSDYEQLKKCRLI
tara:strand:- start:259 stop:435 length:177 start_codon:yes stop_codon:yes gene_type:complete